LKRTKICFIAPFLSELRGGSAISSINLICRLSKLNYKIYVVTSSKRKLRDKIPPNIEIIQIPFMFILPKFVHGLIEKGNFVSDVLFSIYLRKIISSLKPDIIHIVETIEMLPALVRAGFKDKILISIRDIRPLVYHNNTAIVERYSFFKIELVKKIFLVIFKHRPEVYLCNLRHVKLVHAISPYIKSFLIWKGIKSSKIRTVYNIPRSKSLGKPKTYRYGVCASVFNSEKGQEHLINAILKLNLDNLKFRFFFIGYGVSKNKLIAKIPKKYLGSKIIFLGRLKNENIIKLYKRARICFIPSIWPESFGRAIIEAGIFSVPLIVTNRGFPNYFVKNFVCGYSVDPFDSRNYSKKIERLIKDDEIYDKFRDNFFKVFNTLFDPTLLIEKYNDIYEGLKRR